MRKGEKGGKKARREHLAGGAMLGLGAIGKTLAALNPFGPVFARMRAHGGYDLGGAENTINSVCLQCNTGCGIKCKIQDGVLTKIDGNPYSPWTLLPHLQQDTDFDVAMSVDAAICPKGHAGLQTAYDPYRIRKVLKRDGRRGENKWRTISMAQAISEICDGGRLFASVPGEETREVEGLRQLTPLRDTALSASMAADVRGILQEKDKARKQQLVSDFKRKHAAHLDLLIDPDHPDLGPRNNQVVLAWGRVKGGRGDIYKRLAAALGTTNAHGHTTVCQGSLYFTCKAISEQYSAGAFSGGQKFYWQADLENSRFVLFVGANLLEANYGPPNRSVRLTRNLASGKTKIAVADPRFSKLAGKAWKWLPLKPGTDAAVALAMIRWIIDNNRHDARFLSCANRAAAAESGEKSWTNAGLLVEIDAEGRPGSLVRAADAGIVEPVKRQAADGKEYVEKFFLCISGGRPVAVDPNDSVHAVYADLFVDTVLPHGQRVKSGLQILLEEARSNTVEEWARIADVRAEDVVAVVRELTSHGKKVAVDIHRGPAQHTNGFYNVLCWMSLNMLLGNYDHKGGMCKPTAWDTSGKGKTFNLSAHPGKSTAFGISSIRHDVNYEQTTLFEGYPARRNWYPLSSDVYEEIIPSIGDAYPYPVKALFLYMGAPTYALPAGHTNIDILRDVNKLPLFVANDILVGPTSMYADYIFPDLTYLERWEYQGSHPNIANKVQPVRQPVIAPIPESCTVFGQETPVCFESMIMGIAEHLALPGFGADAFGPGLDFNHMDDYYLRGVANLAFGEKPDGSQSVPDAGPREIEIFLKARRHLTSEVYSEKRWKAVVGEKLWPKVVYVLNRGGRFENHEKGYDGEMLAHPYAALLNLYQEKTAGVTHSGTGQRYPGYAAYITIRDYHGNEPDSLRRGHDLALVTHRTVVQCKSRTITNPWLRAILPDNGIQVHPSDVHRLGLTDGQMVKVVSATNQTGQWDLGSGRKKAMIGKIVSTQQVRPGVISFSLGYGHWATGAADISIDGHTVKGEPARATGINANAAMWVDPALGNTCFLDPLGGSVSFYDTHVRLVPVT